MTCSTSSIAVVFNNFQQKLNAEITTGLDDALQLSNESFTVAANDSVEKTLINSSFVETEKKLFVLRKSGLVSQKLNYDNAVGLKNNSNIVKNCKLKISDENLDDQLSKTTESTFSSSVNDHSLPNMNNGLSNGHDLNLDLDLNSSTSGVTQTSTTTSQQQLPHLEFHQNNSSSIINENSPALCLRTDPNIFLTQTGQTMGLLNPPKPEKDSSYLVTPNLFYLLKENSTTNTTKAENGQNCSLIKVVDDEVENITSWSNQIKSSLVKRLVNPPSSSSSCITDKTNETISKNIETTSIINSSLSSSSSIGVAEQQRNLEPTSTNLTTAIMGVAGGSGYLIKTEKDSDLIQDSRFLIQHLSKDKHFEIEKMSPNNSINLEPSSTNTMSSFKNEFFSTNDDQMSMMRPQQQMNIFDKSTNNLGVVNNNLKKELSNSTTNTSYDLSVEQKEMQRHCRELLHRLRRIQIQHNHKVLNKEMKSFVANQQTLNAVKCQRFEATDYFVGSGQCFSSSIFDNTTSNSGNNFMPIQSNFPNKNNINYSTYDQFQQLIGASNNNNNNSRLMASLSTNHHSVIKLQEPLVSDQYHSQNHHRLQNQQKSPILSSFNVKEEQANFIQKCRSTLCNNYLRRISHENKDLILSTIDSLRFNLRNLESNYDSDATESSSGGESCDEFEECQDEVGFGDEDSDHAFNTASNTATNSQTTPAVSKFYTPIKNRLIWKWCNERSSIAARWSWLQAHIADLETKLRQQNNLFQHLRANKGQINFGHNQNEPPIRQFPSVQQQINNQTSIQQQQQGSSNHQSPSSMSSSFFCERNSNSSLKTDSSITSEVNNSDLKNQNEENECMRAIPFISMKKRKLLRLESTLSMASTKKAVIHSVPCSCIVYAPHIPPCVICNGRYSYMNTMDTDFMPYYERVSLLDPSCHPVLCLPNEVSLGLHINNLLKRETFLNKPNLIKNINKRKKTSLNNQSVSNEIQTAKSRKQHLSNSIQIKLKKKSALLKNKKPRRVSSDSARKPQRDRLSSGCSSRADSPVPSPSHSDTSSTGGASGYISTPTIHSSSAPLNRRRRSEQHAFDINNIVIPYSIAATTRLERLQYKEIITPKWRVFEEYSIPPSDDVKQEILKQLDASKIEIEEKEEIEDISDSAYELRHSKCEAIERRRVMTYYGKNQKNQNTRTVHQKGSRAVRFESESDSINDQTSQDSMFNNSSSSKLKSKASYYHSFGGRDKSSFNKSSTSSFHISKEGEEESLFEIDDESSLHEFPESPFS